MTRALLTAFEPYDRWADNASWLALVELTRWYEGPLDVITRRYPVDLAAMSGKLRGDLSEGFDVVIHLGQAPGATGIRLESVGLNLRSDGSPIVPEAAEAYRTSLPLAGGVRRLRDAGIPSEVSHHAGTYLCNAALYLSQYYIETLQLATRVAFVHVPLTPAQVAAQDERLASMSTPITAAAVALLVETFAAACRTETV